MSVGVVLAHRGIQSHPLPCQTPFGRGAALLPSVTQPQHLMGWMLVGRFCSAAVPPAPTSDCVSQCNEIEGITFGAITIRPLHLERWVLDYSLFYNLLEHQALLYRVSIPEVRVGGESQQQRD